MVHTQTQPTLTLEHLRPAPPTAARYSALRSTPGYGNRVPICRVWRVLPILIKLWQILPGQTFCLLPTIPGTITIQQVWDIRLSPG